MKAWSAQSAKRAAVGRRRHARRRVAARRVRFRDAPAGCRRRQRRGHPRVRRAQTFDQLKAAKLDFAENIVVTALVAAPLLKDAVATSGSWKPDADLRLGHLLDPRRDRHDEGVRRGGRPHPVAEDDAGRRRRLPRRPREGRHHGQPQVRLGRPVRRGTGLLHDRSADARLGQAGRPTPPPPRRPPQR